MTYSIVQTNGKPIQWWNGGHVANRDEVVLVPRMKVDSSDADAFYQTIIHDLHKLGYSDRTISEVMRYLSADEYDIDESMEFVEDHGRTIVTDTERLTCNTVPVEESKYTDE